MVTIKTPDLPESWLKALSSEFQKDYFKALKAFLLQEKAAHPNKIYPPGKQIFSAFHHTPLDELKVVIIGQDPYHGPGQANGLCFSVSDGIVQPPSLKNIFKEIERDLSIPTPSSGNLERWAKQGVMLLNATLTVRHKTPGSHQKRGWEQFTDKVIQTISSEKTDVVFLLWGSFAQQKAQLIDQSKHHILQTTHPSPFSAHRGFLGSGHFSKCNEILASKGLEPVSW